MQDSEYFSDGSDTSGISSANRLNVKTKSQHLSGHWLAIDPPDNLNDFLRRFQIKHGKHVDQYGIVTNLTLNAKGIVALENGELFLNGHILKRTGRTGHEQFYERISSK